ncbi:MAG: endonuclease, partial [Pseudomonadota bacterium]
MARKIIITFLINLFLMSYSRADSNIYVLNNTDEVINVFSSGDSNIISGDGIDVIEPYQYFKVSKLSRYSNIESGKSYYFFIFLG